MIPEFSDNDLIFSTEDSSNKVIASSRVGKVGSDSEMGDVGADGEGVVSMGGSELWMMGFSEGVSMGGSDGGVGGCSEGDGMLVSSSGWLCMERARA